MSQVNNTAINTIIQTLANKLPPEEIVQNLGVIVNDIIPFDRFSLGLAQLRYWYYYQDGHVSSKRNFSPQTKSSSASAWVFFNQAPCLRTDINQDSKFEHDHTLQQDQMRSDLILPLGSADCPIGTFNFTSKTPNCYTQEHLVLATDLQHLIGLCAQTMIDNLNKDALEHVTQNIQNTRDTNVICQYILEHLHKQYDRVRIYLYDPKTNTMQGKFQISKEGFGPLLNRSYPLEADPYTHQTMHSQHPQIYSSDQLNTQGSKNPPNEKNGPPLLNNKEWAEIPLKAHTNEQEYIVGKISLDNHLTQIPLQQENLNSQTIFTRQAALAIRHAQLYNQMSDQVDHRTHQLSATNRQLEAKEKLLTALQEVSHNSFSYLNQDEILDNFTQRIIRAGICRSLMIALPDYQTNTVEVVRAFQRELPEGPDGPIKIVNYAHTCGTRYSLDDDNITPLTVRTGQMQIIETKEDNRLDARFERFQDWDDKIAYFIPIKREDKVVALLATGTTRKEKSDFLERLKTMAPIFDQLGIALEHANLYQSTQTNEAHYRSLFENMQSGFAYHQILTDAQGAPTDYVFLEINDSFEKMTGLKKNQIIGKPVTEVLPNIDQDPADWIGLYGKVAQTGKPIHFENYAEALDRWYTVSAYSPQKGYFVTLFTEITERKRSEEKLAELLDFQVKMLDTPVVWICAFDNERKMIFWNRGAELISGYPAEKVVGSSDVWDELYPDANYFDNYIRSTKEILDQTGRIENIESEIHCFDGTKKTITWYANRLIGNDDEHVGFLAIGLDITQHKQLETEIVRLERLKALGELAAGVSHNLNNMLTGILLPAAMLKNTNLPTTAQENVEDIFLSATRARDLVAELNQSVRRDITDLLEPVDVNRAIAEAVRATRARWKDESEANGLQIQLNMTLKATTPARATTSGLHDVLINLIFNAIDALPKGGHITITSNMLANGIQLTVEDNGIGMAPDTQLKVFEPFFTTKMNVGTGLGLSTAYSQVQRWDGSLTVKSDLGKGTKFTLELPLWTEAFVVQQKPALRPTTPQRILIVEDDPMIRRTLKRYLSDHHTVTLAANGQQARFALDTDAFDLAIIDLGLPDIPGDELAREFKNKSQNLPTILITGWSLSENDPRKDPFQAYLQKPIVDPKDLLRTIDQLTEKDAG